MATEYMPTSRRAPPACAMPAFHHCQSSGFARISKNARTVRGRPIRPSAIQARALRTAGKQRVHMPSIRKRPFSRASASTASSCRRLSTMGFSLSTFTPAFSAATMAA